MEHYEKSQRISAIAEAIRDLSIDGDTSSNASSYLLAIDLMGREIERLAEEIERSFHKRGVAA